jgi:DNA-binding NarL/FixJ family response regulator
MKLLLVEDSARLRHVIEENLTEYRPLAIEHFATTQAEAIKLLDTQQFDMMLVDIELADGNGFNVIKHTLCNDYPFKPPLVVILTNHAYGSYRKKARQLGVTHFFDKSMEFDLAVETILHEADRFSTANTKH